MIDFPDNYFQKEVRDGLEIPSMMKRAWAGQLEVLQVIREICERHHIKWFADYGTLLGAVRQDLRVIIRSKFIVNTVKSNRFIVLTENFDNGHQRITAVFQKCATVSCICPLA